MPHPLPTRLSSDLEEEKTKGGIIIPDSAKEKPIEGKVIAVGNGKVQEDGKVRPLDVKAGDRILFSKYAGRSEEPTSELQSLMRISYAVFCLKKKTYTETPNELQIMTRTTLS